MQLSKHFDRSSRGIGLAIARKLAADGANITIAAKTAEPHAKLAEEIKKVRLFCF